MRICRKGTLALFALTSVITSLMLLNIKTGKTSSTTIYLDPPATTQPISANFTVSIKIQDVTDLVAWQTELNWDPEVLDFVDAARGDFLQAGGGWGVWTNQSEGWIGVYCIADKLNGSSGSGTLANVTFHGVNTNLDERDCILNLTNTRLISSGTISVSTPPYLGDVNGDLKVYIVDMSAVALAWWTSPGDPRYNQNADFNKDDLVDLYDFMCTAFNMMRTYPGDARQPVEITHEVHNGHATIYPPSFTVSWKWLDLYENPLWLTVNVTVSSNCTLENFSFNRSWTGQIGVDFTSTGQISFSFTSAEPGFCNVSVPKLLMNGAFKVLINDTQMPSMLTWNDNDTFIYFIHDQGSFNVTIVGEIVTKICSLDLSNVVDINGDGIVNIIDISKVSKRFQWKEDLSP